MAAATHKAKPNEQKITPLLKKKLDSLIALGSHHDNLVDRRDINNEFSGLTLQDEHLKIICSYLEEHGITIVPDRTKAALYTAANMDPFLSETHTSPENIDTLSDDTDDIHDPVSDDETSFDRDGNVTDSYSHEDDSDDYTKSDEYRATEEAYNVTADTSAVTDSLRMYLREIGNIPLLTAEQETEIGRQMENGKIASRILTEGSLRDCPDTDNIHTSVPEDLGKYASEEDKLEVLSGKTRSQLRSVEKQGQAARTRLEESNLRLVVSIAKKYVGFGIPLSDLIQEGNIGLMKAVDKFEYRKGYKFSTYASWWIRQAITRYLADTGRTIRIPVHMHEKFNKLNRLSKQFLQEHGREATPQELAELMNVSADEVKELQKLAQDTISLDSPVGDEDDSHLGDFIADSNMAEPFEATADTLLREQLEEVLSTLTEREQEILRLRVGFDNGRPMTLEEVGELYGLTRERIRQIESKALRKLKHPKKSRLLADYI